MKADSLKIVKVFSNGGFVHYILPHFQRQYSWNIANWRTLLDDALAIYQEFVEERQPEHFLGSLVVIEDGTRKATIPAFTLVDGQQRLTTISILLCAFHDLIRESDSATARSVQRLLVNVDVEDQVYFKILPTNKYGDRAAYQALLTGKEVDNSESLIPKAYAYFYQELEKHLAEKTIAPGNFYAALCNCFQLVFIELSKDESPYKIFESLNAKGKPLSQADLVRNYIAMRLPSAQQEKIFSQYWEGIESLLQENRSIGRSRISELTGFIRHYLAIDSRTLCSEEHIYARFRDHCEKMSIATFIKELEKLKRFAEYYNKLLRPENEPNIAIREALVRLNILEVQTAYPLLLAAYDAYETWLNLEDFKAILQILENYIVRRFICGEPTSYLSKIFLTLWRDVIAQIDTGLDYEASDTKASVKDALTRVIITKNYPPDRKIQQAVGTTKLYDQRSREKVCLILTMINQQLSQGTGGMTVLDGKATIEHILPQTLNQVWRADLGEDSERIYEDYLHTLGNLTLINSEWNSALSNSSFSLKKASLQSHALRLNQSYFSHAIDQWNEAAILQRADFLASKFLEIWESLGETSLATEKTYSKPNAIVIRDERIEIPNKTWKQGKILIAEWVLKNHFEKFGAVKQSIQIFISSVEGQKYPQDWHQLSNGNWMYVSNSAKEHVRHYNRILSAIGVSESEWQIEEIG